jgi:hypothetical protein
MIRAAALAGALLAAAPVAAQGMPGAAPAQALETQAPTPGRLALARRVMDVVLPPARREAMVTDMTASIYRSMVTGLESDPELSAMMQRKPRAAEVFRTFLDREQATGIAQLKADLPAMIEAMARAYARLFTEAQMQDMLAFFSTPTGAAYLERAPMVMADPDVSAWMSSSMAKTMKRLPDRMKALMTELKALEEEKK